jgi:integrase
MPIVLTIEQIAALLRILKEPTRTMVLLAVFTGLRVGELLGLKWKDIDFQKMEIHVIRSIVMQHVGDCKTEASRKPVQEQGLTSGGRRGAKHRQPHAVFGWCLSHEIAVDYFT